MTDTTQTQEQTGDQTSVDQTGTQSGSQTDAKATGAGKAAGAKDHGTTKGPAIQAEEQSWYAGLPDDLKGEKSILRHANLEDAIRAGLGAEKRLGVPADQLIRKPTKPEEVADVYRALGAPETPEGYNIALPEGASAEDKATATRFAQAMFEKGPFPHDAVKAAVEFMNAETAAADEALTAADAERKAQGEALLKKELGQTYDPEMKAVGKLLNDLGGEELAKELDASGLGDNPRLMLALQKVVDRLAEPGAVLGQNSGTGAAGQMTPGQAKAARLNLENDPVTGLALQTSDHAMHKSVVEQRKRLVRIEEGLDPDT